MEKKNLEETIDEQQKQIEQQQAIIKNLEAERKEMALQLYREQWSRWDSEAKCKSLKGFLERKTAEVQRLRVSGGKDYVAKLEAEKAREEAQKALADEEKAHEKTKKELNSLNAKLTDTRDNLSKAESVLKEMEEFALKQNDLIQSQNQTIEDLLNLINSRLMLAAHSQL